MSSNLVFKGLSKWSFAGVIRNRAGAMKAVDIEIFIFKTGQKIGFMFCLKYLNTFKDFWK